MGGEDRRCTKAPEGGKQTPDTAKRRKSNMTMRGKWMGGKATTLSRSHGGRVHMVGVDNHTSAGNIQKHRKRHRANNTSGQERARVG